MQKAFRGSIFHCLSDPGPHADDGAVEHVDDGLLIVEDGRVIRTGSATELLGTLSPEVEVVDHSGKLIVPGLIDCHVHYSQVDIIASYGEQLLDWLSRYAYPAEMRFADASHAKSVADFFLDELLRNGTTTAAVFATVFPQSVDAIFAAAEERGMRLIAGKVLMDEHCPEELRDDPQSAYDDSKALIEKWHGKGYTRTSLKTRKKSTKLPRSFRTGAATSTSTTTTACYASARYMRIACTSTKPIAR